MNNSEDNKNLCSHNITKQLPYNFIANTAYFIVNFSIGLILVPFFINSLGISAYGIIPLATTITGYVATVVFSLNTVINRYLTVDLQNGDFKMANKTFNTAFFGLGGIIILTSPIIFIIAGHLPFFFNIPVDQSDEIFLFFLTIFAAFFLRSWFSVFEVVLFAYNRLDLKNIINLTNLLIQTAIIAVLLSTVGPNLSFVGIGYLVGAIIASALSIVLARQVCPFIKMSLYDFDFTKIIDIVKMGWWVVIDHIGSLLLIQIDLVVVNILFGSITAGEYAIALQLVILIRALSGMLGSIMVPPIMIYYARNQIYNLILLSKTAVKMMGLAMALPIGLICGLTPEILTIWVGEEFISISPLLILLIFHLAMNLSVIPLFPISITYNKVRVPGIITLIMGLCNVILAFGIPIITGLGYYGIAIAGCIVLTIKNGIFTPWYISKLLKIKEKSYFYTLLMVLFVTIVTGISTKIFSISLPFSSTINLFIIASIITTLYFLLVWAYALNSFERKFIMNNFPLKFHKTFN